MDVDRPRPRNGQFSGYCDADATSPQHGGSAGLSTRPGDLGERDQGEGQQSQETEAHSQRGDFAFPGHMHAVQYLYRTIPNSSDTLLPIDSIELFTTELEGKKIM